MTIDLGLIIIIIFFYLTKTYPFKQGCVDFYVHCMLKTCAGAFSVNLSPPPDPHPTPPHPEPLSRSIR